jgi:two-component system cell cycle response regulator
MQPQDVLKTILSSDALPTLPTVASKLVSMISHEETAIGDIADVISKDMSLAAKLLKVANSSFYSFATKIGSINQAVSAMGTNAVRSLVLSFSFLNIKRSNRADIFDYDRFWEKSLAAAVAAKLIAAPFQKIEAEEIFIAGLLQNIGEMLIARAYPKQYREVLAEFEKDPSCLVDSELALVGADHTFIGYAVTRHWNFPPFLLEPIRFHHRPEDYTGNDPRLALAIKAVHLADMLVNILYAPRPAMFHAQFREKCQTMIGLDVQSIDRILETVHTDIGRIAEDFGLKIENPKAIEEILQEANIALGLMNLNYEQVNKALVQAKLELQQLNLELEEKNRRLEKLAHLDGLTEVYNHRYFQNFLEKEISRANRNERNISLIMIDVDHFKMFNDENGHQEGDLVLKELCRLIQANLREYDLLARYGGEEFVVVLPETEKQAAETVAEKLRLIINENRFAGEQKNYHVTVSMGVAGIRPAHDPFRRDELIGFADKALYTSKRQGRNRVTVHEPKKKWFGKGWE